MGGGGRGKRSQGEEVTCGRRREGARGGLKRKRREGKEEGTMGGEGRGGGERQVVHLSRLQSTPTLKSFPCSPRVPGPPH